MAKKKKKPDPPALPPLDLSPEGRKQLHDMYRALRQQVASALAYLGGAIFTAFVPLPSLGITPEVIENLHLTGSGLWIEQPWTVLAFGALYFALLAYAKIKPSVVTIVEAPAGKSGP